MISAKMLVTFFFLAGEEMKQIASGFLQVLYDADPQAVGGTLPDDGLYFVG